MWTLEIDLLAKNTVCNNKKQVWYWVAWFSFLAEGFGFCVVIDCVNYAEMIAIMLMFITTILFQNWWHVTPFTDIWIWF